MIAAGRSASMRWLLGILGIGGLLWLAPAGAQVNGARLAFRTGNSARLEILPPLPGSGETLLADQKFTVRWVTMQDDDGLDRRDVPSITWYYTPNDDGGGRRRMVSVFHDGFETPLNARWISANPLRQDWDVLREPGSRLGRRILRGRPTGVPLISLENFDKNFVVSARLRPREGAANFGVAMRAAYDDAACYSLRGMAELLNPENPKVRAQKQLQGLDPNQWYWYELGVRSGRGSTMVRARIWDGDHNQVLNTLSMLDAPGQARCPNGTRIGLLAGADYSDIYVDPWEARWPAGPKGEFAGTRATFPRAATGSSRWLTWGRSSRRAPR